MALIQDNLQLSVKRLNNVGARVFNWLPNVIKSLNDDK